MPYSQATRSLRITTPLGEEVLLLESFQGVEGISRPFLWRVDMLSEAGDLTLRDLLGKDATVSIASAAGTRSFHGCFTRVAFTGRQGGLYRYSAELRPWLWLLTQVFDCRVFQDLSVPEIVEDVFRRRGVRDFRFALTKAAYRKRTYCVQYRESDFAFVSRLLEDEGIHYWFEHEAGRHCVVLGDAPGHHRPCAGQALVSYRPHPRGILAEDVVRTMQIEEQVLTSRVALRDFNFETPSLDLGVQREQGSAMPTLEAYDYPGVYADADGGAAVARTLLEAQDTARCTAWGDGICRSFAVGATFSLHDHPRAELCRDWLLVEVQHTAREAYLAGAGGDGDLRYGNDFRVIPADAPLRPARLTPRPRIVGTQTAIVVGPAGEEIHTDRHGRVKLHFHWDRVGARDGTDSCWVRVSQSWAGKNWGAMFLPRIGQEVIVEFLEGDPDRPLVTGRVYNAQQMPPYDLPGNKTVSTVKTRSSKGGGPANFNEIRFEDRKGKEEVYIHAERNHTQETEHDRNEHVGHDRSLVVDHDKAEHVKHDKSVTIDNDLTEHIKHDKGITVDNDHTEVVHRNMTLTVDADRTMTVKKNLSELVQQDMRTTVQRSQEITVQKDQCTSVSGDCGLTVEKDYSITVSKEMTTSVSKDLTCTVEGDSTYETSKEHSVEAKKIVLEATDEIELKVGPASLKLTKTGELTAQGITVAITGAATVTVKGGQILLN